MGKHDTPNSLDPEDAQKNPNREQNVEGLARIDMARQLAAELDGFWLNIRDQPGWAHTAERCMAMAVHLRWASENQEWKLRRVEGSQ